MKPLFSLIILLSFVGCDQDLCRGIASCAAPPEGEFQRDQYNIAILPAIVREGTNRASQEELRLDSVIVHASSDIFVDAFYTWISIQEPESVTSFTLYGEEETIVVNGELPDLTGDLKGFIVKFIKNNDSVSVSGNQASEDTINRVCNDVIDC
ncbi:hypothetical protein [Ekhidna sp.]|uniref:hypothetical protein n=1 Tax=Ekhidna sp. TaxID=2608089 RepID=UPI00329A7536